MRAEAFERLWEAHAKQLMGFLVYRTGDVSTAEDIVADTFERVLRARRPFDPRKGSEKNWIYSIALNVLRDRERRKNAETKALQRVGAPEPASPETPFTEQVETRDAVIRALSNLSPEEREAISLRFGAGMTVPEVARVLSEPLKRVESRIFRALEKLRGEIPPEACADEELAVLPPSGRSKLVRGGPELLPDLTRKHDAPHEQQDNQRDSRAASGPAGIRRA